MHARVVLGVGKGVLFREVSSVQECPHRERLYTYAHSLGLCFIDRGSNLNVILTG